ncbi:MAG: hypothetical protein LBH25_01045 [Fibromonadaceae bacterium]|jgi:hypothetical protein|nr:hypothetical protein [Fibromonadaceae bacterium]
MAGKPVTAYIRRLAQFCSMPGAYIAQEKKVCGELRIGGNAYSQYMKIRRAFIEENPAAMPAPQCLLVLINRLDAYRLLAEFADAKRKIINYGNEILGRIRFVEETGRELHWAENGLNAYGKTMLAKLVPRYNELARLLGTGDVPLEAPRITQQEHEDYLRVFRKK